jgi:undecaprenyl-diphosphooligosaccharide--protein glycosyltransferase
MMIAALIQKVDAAQTCHNSLTDRQWLQPLSGRWYVVAVIIATSIAAYMNYYVRASQYDIWQQNPEIFALDDGMQLFTTADAGYFIGLAQSIKRDGNFQTFNEKRLYPTNINSMQLASPPASIFDAPLLSSLIAIVADGYSSKALLKAAHWLIPVTAAVTALFIVFAFGSVGYWLEGALAAAGGGLSLAYMTRSGAGRIDTDQLNLGFFYLMFGLVIFAARAKSLRTSLALAVLAGAVMWVFNWWYAKPLFGWAFLIALVWLSAVCHRDWKRSFYQAAIFCLLSGLSWGNTGIGQGYYLSELGFGGLVFPNSFVTITELTVLPFLEVLERISGSFWLGMVGIIAVGLWSIRHPVLAIVFVPAAAFMFLNFYFGTRTIFYSAPFLWFGLAWALVTGVRALLQILKTGKAVQYATISTSVVFGFMVIWVSSPIDYLVRPSFPKPALEGLSSLATLPSDEQTVVASWWDYGYASVLLNNFNVLHDGGGQNTPVTHYVARALMANSQSEAAGILTYFSENGMEDFKVSIAGDKNFDTKLGLYQKTKPQQAIYMVLSDQLADWMPSISKVGLWDPTKGVHTFPAGTKPEDGMGYKHLKCDPMQKPDIIQCAGRSFNLKTGMVDKKPLLAGLIQMQDGTRTVQRDYKNDRAPFIMHLIKRGDNAPQIFLAHRRLFNTVFHQMFYLNEVNKQFFEPILVSDPAFKVFKVK